MALTTRHADDYTRKHVSTRPQKKRKITMECIIDDCTGPPLHLYRFPKDDLEMLEKWLQNLKIDKLKLRSKSRICNKHFEASCIGEKKLIQGAIPTLYLGHDDKNINFPIKKNQKKTQFRHCSMKSCTGSSQNSGMHAFPAKTLKRRAWLKACGLQDKVFLYLCEKHFDPAHIKANKRLTSNAIPIVEKTDVDQVSVKEEDSISLGSVQESHDNIFEDMEDDESIGYEQQLQNGFLAEEADEETIDLDDNFLQSCEHCENNKKQSTLLQTELAEERTKAKAMQVEISSLKSKILSLEDELKNLRKTHSVNSAPIDIVRYITNDKRPVQIKLFNILK